MRDSYENINAQFKFPARSFYTMRLLASRHVLLRYYVSMVSRPAPGETKRVTILETLILGHRTPDPRKY